MVKYWNGDKFASSASSEFSIKVTMAEFDRFVCGRNKGLVLSSNSDGYPILTNPYSGEEYTGDWQDFDITAEAEYIEMQRVRSIHEQIAELAQILTSTDYKVIKNREYIDAGLEPYYDPMELHNERELIRAQIRELEQLIK